MGFEVASRALHINGFTAVSRLAHFPTMKMEVTFCSEMSADSNELHGDIISEGGTPTFSLSDTFSLMQLLLRYMERFKSYTLTI